VKKKKLLALAPAEVPAPSISIVSTRRAERHWPVIELNSFSAIFSQLPCLGV